MMWFILRVYHREGKIDVVGGYLDEATARERFANWQLIDEKTQNFYYVLARGVEAKDDDF